MKGFSIAGIGTDVGKTVLSAIIAEAIEGVYFKPVQAGDLDNSDSIKVKKWCSDKVEVLPEVYRLSEPMAPHAAAKIDKVKLSLKDIVIPQTTKPLILEGAGGILVPLNENNETMLDVYKKAKLPVILISRHYLGSINHTLMTFELLKSKGLKLAGIIYVGEENVETESIIEKFTDLKKIGRVVLPEQIDSEFIQETAKSFKGLYYEFSR